MATLAPNGTDNAQRRTKTARPPILVHPAFPAVVALWFAALLGLGSLILPDALFNTGVEATGIASVIPAATPPLGGFARTIIALIAALIGAVLGLFLTRQMAKSFAEETGAEEIGNIQTVQDAPQAKRKRGLFSGETADDTWRPISAHEELGQEGFGRFESATQDDWASIDEDTSYVPSAPMPETTSATAAGAAIAAALIAPSDSEAESEPAKDELSDEQEPTEFEHPVQQAENQNEDAEEKLTEAAQCLALAKTGEECGVLDWRTQPLKDLSLLHLTQRLASGFEARQQRSKKHEIPSFAESLAIPSGLEAAPEEDAESARAAFFSSADEGSQDVPLTPNTQISTAAPIGPDAIIERNGAIIEENTRPDFSKPLKNEANQDALRDALKKLQGFSGAA